MLLAKFTAAPFACRTVFGYLLTVTQAVAPAIILGTRELNNWRTGRLCGDSVQFEVPRQVTEKQEKEERMRFVES